MNRLILAMIAALFMGVTACAPVKVEQIVEIQPDETAFMIMLEGDTLEGQSAFASEEFLEQSKVATKRVSLPQRWRSTGRFYFNGEWIPTATVITVDRTPVTREWTSTGNTGTSKSNEAISVESSDSIAFQMGANMTASVPENFATKFLFNYSGKPLEDVVDDNVRGYISTVLSREFGSRELEEGRSAKAEIFQIAFEEAQTYFAAKGVSIDYFGFTQGMTYDDKEIQDGINRVFAGQMDVQAAEQEEDAQEIRNRTLLAKVTAESEAAKEFAKNQEAAAKIRQLEIDMVLADAELEKAKKWNGQLPANVMPAGAGYLFNLDTK